MRAFGPRPKSAVLCDPSPLPVLSRLRLLGPPPHLRSRAGPKGLTAEKVASHSPFLHRISGSSLDQSIIRNQQTGRGKASSVCRKEEERRPPATGPWARTKVVAGGSRQNPMLSYRILRLEGPVGPRMCTTPCTASTVSGARKKPGGIPCELPGWAGATCFDAGASVPIAILPKPLPDACLFETPEGSLGEKSTGTRTAEEESSRQRRAAWRLLYCQFFLERMLAADEFILNRI